VAVSDISNIEPILNEVARIKPAGICELGVGFGKYGVLCREVLEAVEGRCRPDQWQTLIVGVEGFPEYNNPCWQVYNVIKTEDFRQSYEKVTGWPLVMMIDSLEHVEMTEAQTILRYLVENNQRVLISVPLGNCPQDGVFGNELERHRSTWTGAEFRDYDYRVLHKGVCLVVIIQGVRK
jgi:hypothetical protein